MLAMAEGIKASSHLHEFRLARNGFTDEGAQALGQAIGASTSLLEWTLDDCDIDANTQAPTLASALLSSTSLREFHMKIGQDSQATRRGVFDRVAQRFNGAVAQSNSLLHMGMEPEWATGCYQAQARLMENRRRPFPRL